MEEILDIVSQIGIAFFGIIAVVLVSKKNKWGFVFGLISQPFFFLSAWINQQWGFLILAVAYTLTWGFGIYEWFFKNSRNMK